MSEISVKHAMEKYGSNMVIPDLNTLTEGGELLTSLEPSGCGKAALLRMITGFNSIEDGDICSNDTRINDMDSGRRSIGMVFQNYAIFLNTTIYDNVAFGLKSRKIDKDEIKEQTDEYLNLIQVMQYTERMPNQLSGGQQQRMVLARALVIMSDVFLMNEPPSNLDVELRLETRSVIRHAQKDVGITIIYVIHDQEEAMAISDTIAAMKDGVVRYVGSPKNVYQRPENVFAVTSIGRTDIVFARVERGAVVFPSGYRVELNCLKQAGGREVLRFIRPEEFVISPERNEGIQDAMKGYTYLSPDTHYFTETEDHMMAEIVEEFSVEDRLKPNQRVLLQVKKHKINLFNKEGNVNLVRNGVYKG